MSRNWEKIQLNDKIREKYLIKRRLVPGGGGPVYSGMDLKTKKVVQIRFFSDDEILDDVSLRYRVEETEKVQEMCGDVVTIPVDYGFFKEVPYIVHKFGDIKTLHQVLTTENMMGEQAARPLIGTLLTMLGEIHDGGVVHLGLSPLSIYQRQSSMNIFAPGVLDFGLVPFRGHSYFSYPGSVDSILNYVASYASPEQASYDEIVDHRADLFSVGVLVFRLVLGETPFKGKNTEEILGKVVSETPSCLFDDSAGMSKGIRDFLFKALQKEPRDRFQSASGMLESFLDSFGHEPMRKAGEEEDAGRVEGESKDVVKNGEDLPTARIDVPPVVITPVKPITAQEPATENEGKTAEQGPPAVPKGANGQVKISSKSIRSAPYKARSMQEEVFQTGKKEGAYGQVKISSKSIRSAPYKARFMQEEVLQTGKKEDKAAAEKGVKKKPPQPAVQKAAVEPAEQAPEKVQQVEKAQPQPPPPQQKPPPPSPAPSRPVEPITVEASSEEAMPVETTQEKVMPPDPSRQSALQQAQEESIPVAPAASGDEAIAKVVDQRMQQAEKVEPEEAAQPATAGDRGADLLAGLDDFDVEEEEPPPEAPRQSSPAQAGASPNAAAGQAKARGEREMEMEYQGALEDIDLGMERMDTKSSKKGPKPRAKPRIKPRVKKLLREGEKINLPPSIAFEKEDAPEEPKSLKDRFKGFIKKK